MVKKKRRSIGTNPLDAVLGSKGAPEEAPRPTGRAKPTKAPEKQKPRAIRCTYHLAEDLAEEAKDAAVFWAGPPEMLTLSGLVRVALRRELDRLRKKYLDGEPIPERGRELTGGRPIGSGRRDER